jgi:hypothetical protein
MAIHRRSRAAVVVGCNNYMLLKMIRMADLSRVRALQQQHQTMLIFQPRVTAETARRPIPLHGVPLYANYRQ